MANILIVDDNFELTRLINLYLARNHRTNFVYSLKQARSIVTAKHFDLIILDRILPDGDGLQLLSFLEDKKVLTPVLIMSHKSQVEERVRGLRLGADDYLGKPFAMDEFLLKVEKLLSITKNVSQNKIQIGRVTILEKEGKVAVDGRDAQLRPREFELLLFLARHQNQVISRDTIIGNLWDESRLPSYTTIDVYIRRIRLQLGNKYRHWIKTIRGYGYMIKADAALLSVCSPGR